MRRNLFLMVLLAGLALNPGVRAQADLAPGFDGLEMELAKVSLQPVAAAIPVLVSPSAASRGVSFAAVIHRASGYFERKLGWRSEFRLVILNREDWAKVASVPYPAPHVWSRERLVVMPDSLAGYPGFSTWGFDDQRLNEILTVHEIGHALVHKNAIRWDRLDHAADELLANVMMASFLLEDMPGMVRLLEGAPAGFNPAGSASLADLDYVYSGLGLERYAWFQFELARAAGLMVRAKDISVLMPEMKGALDTAQGDLPARLAARLEIVVPGVSKALAAFAPESALPKASIGPCVFLLQPETFTGWSFIAIENQTQAPVNLRNRRDEEGYFALQRDIGKTPETHPEDFTLAPSVVPPGKKRKEDAPIGLDIIVEGRGCVRVPSNPARLVVAD